MKFKKVLSLGLALVMTISAVGCGGATGAATSGDDGAAAEAGAEAGAEQTAGAAASTAASLVEEEFSPSDITVTWDDSRIYQYLTLGKYETITTYGVKGYEDVPFIRVADYLEFMFEGAQRSVVENNVMKISVNETEVVIDPAADTIQFENAAKLRSSANIDGAIVDFVEFNVVTPSTKNEALQTDTVPVTVSLKDYHMPVIAYEDDILMPFLALQNTIGAVRMSNILAYNGKDYYNVVEGTSFAMEQEDAEAAMQTPYMKAVYNGPFSQKEASTQAYADYGYYATCLLLDLTFGHKEEKNVTTFDEYFTRINAKEALCSTNPQSVATAEQMLFNYLFDSGHDAFAIGKTVFGDVKLDDKEEAGKIAEEIKESEEGQELFDDSDSDIWSDIENMDELSMDAILGALYEKGFKIPEVVPLMVWTMYFQSTKPADYGSQRLDYSGDTAVIYFEEFKNDILTRNPSYYLDPMKDEDVEKETFAFFYKCFEDIKQHDEVKNVVINIANNGGGAASELVCVLGFLSPDGEVKFTNRDLVAGNYREEPYHVDTNLDGVADDNDGYGGQYDFYIMTSGSSYSCGTALPYLAQQAGLAKIIGTNPGGGDCILGSFVDAYGRIAYYSGMLKIGTEKDGTFTSDEKSTTMDLNMMPTILDITSVPWFDPDGIADAVHQYQSGVTELTYTNESSEAGDDMVSDFLQNLLEQMENSDVMQQTQEAAGAAAAASDSGEAAASGEAASSGEAAGQ